MPKLTRFEDWSERLQLYLNRVSEEHFEWGEHDCGLFINGSIKAITGHDFIGDLRGTYSTKLEAATVLRDQGFATLEGALRATLGEPVHPALAGRGDVVMLSKACGVVVSHGWSWFVGEQTIGFRPDGSEIKRHGLVQVQTLTCDRAFKVAPVVNNHG